MTRRFEIAAQLGEVVDLAVEDDPDRAVLVVNRLMAGRQIDDAQPPHPERHAFFHPHALVVGAAMADDVAHPMHERAALIGREGRRRCGRFDEACYPAHIGLPRFCLARL